MRIEQITFTRFIAAISIVIFHYGHESDLFFNDYIGFIFKKANIAVSYFFTLSGFVMVIAYNRNEKIMYKNYYKNRIARIYPLYLLAIFLTLGISGLQHFYLIDFFLNVTMTQSWFINKALTINNPGWSLSVEAFFYVVFPFIFNYFYKNYRLSTYIMYIILFWALSQCLFLSIYYNDYFIKFFKYFPLLHLNSFLLGNITAYLFLEKRIKNDKLNLTLTLISIGIIIILLKLPFHTIYHNGLVSIPFCIFIYFLSSLSNKNIFNKTLSKNVFIYLGEISYGIYILQYPLWLFFTTNFMEKNIFIHLLDYPNLLFIVRLVILILLSAITYNIFEIPLRNFIRKNLFN